MGLTIMNNRVGDDNVWYDVLQYCRYLYLYH